MAVELDFVEFVQAGHEANRQTPTTRVGGGVILSCYNILSKMSSLQ